MVSEMEMMTALEKVIDPELGRSIVELKMVRDLKVDEAGRASFTLALTVPGCPLKDKMASEARMTLMALPGITDVSITFGAMTEEERRAVLGQGAAPLPKINLGNQVKKVVAVLSGKGGVGKSSVTAMLAVALRRKGYRVGILDADITGPSIPRLFGLAPGGLRGNDQGILPGITKTGIKVISVNLMVPDEDTPVIWRGPVITGAIRQFWEEVLWGKLDYLLVDLPPGTSDAALAVMQNIPVNGVLLVTTPQELAAMVVRKAVHMINELKTPILGVVENMSYYVCPDTNHRHEIFGPSHVEEIAKAAGVEVWARLPINSTVALLSDAGKVEDVELPEAADLLAQITR